MEGYTSEAEQVENLKKWWKTYGKHIITGVALGAALVGGYQVWRNYERGLAETAALEYQQVTDGLEKNNAAQVLDHGGKLVAAHAGSPYAAYAALAMAKVKLDQGDKVAARTQLQWVLDNHPPLGLEHIARLRLARLLLADNQAAQAQTLINVEKTGSYASLYDEVKGDIAVALNKPIEARTAYARALAALPAGADRQALQTKLDDVGGAATPSIQP